MTRRTLLAGSIVLVGVMVAAACGSDGGTTGPGATGSGVDAAGSLAGVCPDPVVFQTDWNPESEHGQLYDLVGDGNRIDPGGLRVTGPLMASGRDTGVDIEIRAGGPAIGNQTVTSQLYQDPDILLGYVSTDEAILNSGEFPTKAVVAPFAINPQIIMWDPATYPQVKAIKDLEPPGVKVRYFLGASYMDYLVESGQLDRSQVDGSYDGTPANFVAAGGKDAQQGFASSEPYFYEKVLKDWSKPVAYQLIHDAGWTGYTQSLAATREGFAAHTACFERLVPIIQQAQVDYIRDPAKANALIVNLVNEYDNGWQYDEAQAEASIELQLQNGLVANSPDGTLGSFDLDRVRSFLTTAIPIYQAAGARLEPDLSVDSIVTNEFIDPSIAL